MKPHRVPLPSPRLTGSLLLAGFLIILPCRGAEETNPHSEADHPAADSSYQYVTTDPADREACLRQLNFIYGAIREYQRQNQQLPAWLSDLGPEFLRNRDMLVCPFVRKTGNVAKWREKFVVFPVHNDPGLCTYGYEFCQEPIPDLPSVTCREYKLRQMGLIGMAVPVVRCLAHRPVLNLAYDGSIYESGIFWEDNFAQSYEQESVLHDILLTVQEPPNKAVLGLIQGRAPPAEGDSVNLENHYNASLFHLSQLDLDGTLLKTYPEGRLEIDETPFDVRALVHLSARNFLVPFPKAAEEISVGRKCTRIHLLHGAAGNAPAGIQIAGFLFHYEDQPPVEMPIRHGIDVRSRWFDSGSRSGLETPKPAWTSPPELAGPRQRSIRLYHTAWDNPSPDAVIDHVTFVSHMTGAAPFLVAMSLE